MNRVKENIKKIKNTARFDLVSVIFGIFILFAPFRNRIAGNARLNKRIILQSMTMWRKSSKTSRKGRKPRPMPTLIRLLSKKLSEFLKKKVRAKPRPYV